MMKHKKYLIGGAILVVVALIGILCLKYSERTISSAAGYSYSVKHSLKGYDIWVVSTPRITKITQSKSSKTNLSYETGLNEYKKRVDRIIKLEKQLTKERVFLSNAQVVQMAELSPADAMQTFGGIYSSHVAEVCKEIVQLEDECEQIYMTLGKSISD